MSSWLFSEDAFIKESPSRKQKVPVTAELCQRESIHAFLISLGSKLKLDGRTILAATIYINRYYMRLPITSSKYFVASAALAISCKLHENYRQPGKIALHAANLKNPPGHAVIDEQSEGFWKWRDQLLYREELILKTLNFDLNLDLPYDVRDRIVEAQEENNEDEVVIDSDTFKAAITLLEILSSLPLYVAYDCYTALGMALVIVSWEKKEPLPLSWLEKRLGVTGEMCYECYCYVLRLIKYAKSDANLMSNKMVAKRIPNVPKEVWGLPETESKNNSSAPTSQTNPEPVAKPVEPAPLNS
ncbi:hypothetical protein DIURU_002893 [Diutina rugosa]|uniref:Cyclin-like domain-containing protein n=1 Tax=Diutina rugosa TaxID=5481 RepID=A0A642UNS4_DIURU|nr:uncharacterized protein DIURU_002893 [Diutina rugosa]KAA8902439.1 hypothetical protein DIURU_002893 [Diutina rugosa]